MKEYVLLTRRERLTRIWHAAWVIWRGGSVVMNTTIRGVVADTPGMLGLQERGRAPAVQVRPPYVVTDNLLLLCEDDE